MTFEDYWKALQAKNSGLADGENRMTISVDAFKRQLERAFREGSGHGEKFKEFLDKINLGGKRT